MPHEIGTPEYTKYLQSVTPGEAVDSYIREAQKANKDLAASKRIDFFLTNGIKLSNMA